MGMVEAVHNAPTFSLVSDRVHYQRLRKRLAPIENPAEAAFSAILGRYLLGVHNTEFIMEVSRGIICYRMGCALIARSVYWRKSARKPTKWSKKGRCGSGKSKSCGSIWVLLRPCKSMRIALVPVSIADPVD